MSYEKQSYREIFKSCLTSHEGMADIKIDELDHVQVSSSSWTTQHRIVLSCDLLPWISVEGGIHCSLVYQPGYLSYPSYRIFDFSTQLFSVSSSHSHSLYFLELFQLKVERFFIYFDQFVQNALYVIILQDLCLIRWRLLSSGLNECNRKKETPSQTQ